MPASRLYMKSMFGQFDTRRKIGHQEMEAKSVSLQLKWAVLEKAAAKNDVGVEELKSRIRFESF